MPDGRPGELTNYLEAASEKNDAMIAEALGKLEDSKSRGKLKATVATICSITGLSRNTIRNREWALKRLKAIKEELKEGSKSLSEDDKIVENKQSIQQEQRMRMKNVLKQNALLYEEILALHHVIARKDAEISELENHRF